MSEPRLHHSSHFIVDGAFSSSSVMPFVECVRKVCFEKVYLRFVFCCGEEEAFSFMFSVLVGMYWHDVIVRKFGIHIGIQATMAQSSTKADFGFMPNAGNLYI
jgi:hypothetical protein